MANTKILKGKMALLGITLNMLAEQTNMSRSNLSAKINGHLPMNSDEIKRICAVLKISDPQEITYIFLQ